MASEIVDRIHGMILNERKSKYSNTLPTQCFAEGEDVTPKSVHSTEPSCLFHILIQFYLFLFAGQKAIISKNGKSKPLGYFLS